jgi:hypothetical protein
MANEILKQDDNSNPVMGGLYNGEIRNVAVDNTGALSTAPSATSPESTEHDATLDAKTVTDVKLTIRVATHSVTPTLEYIGEALAGSVEGSAVWGIRRIDTATGTIVLWADGNTNFDNIWTNRESLSYS